MKAERTMPRGGRGQGGGPGGFGPGAGMGQEKARDFKGTIKKLLRYMRPHYLQLILVLIFTSAACVLTILAPSKINEITSIIEKGVITAHFTGMPVNIDLQAVGRIGTILIVYYLCSFAGNFITNFIMAGVTQRVTRKMRGELSEKINKVPLKYFDSRTYGETLSRVTNDIDTLGQALQQSLGSLISSVVLVTGSIIAMFITKWQMALVALLVVPLSFILIIVVVGISQKFFVGQQKYLGALNGQIEEVYSGQTVVKAFGGEERALKNFDEVNEKLYKAGKKAQFLSGTMMPIMSFIANLSFVAVCVTGGLLRIKGKADLGDIAAFFIYVRLFQNPLSQLAQVANTLQSAAAAAERVFEFLAEPEQENEERKLAKIENVVGEVEFKSVKFGYDAGKPIINEFSASIKAGQKVAIVGPTGAGKTTLVNLLMRFYEIWDGDITVDGVSINSMRREDVRAMFGMVLQDTWLFEGTIRQNIIYNKENVTDEEVARACKAANIDHFISTLPGGYDMVLDDQANISAGQKQLLTIARAMVQNSPMLILDEATSSVDTRTELLIQNAMDSLTKGRTSFVIAHRLSTIKNADVIFVMKDGDIIERGNHAELIAQNGFYANLYNSQFAE